MKIVIAPDSFKESLTAQQVAEAIKRGFQQSIADVECLLCPVGDGGEGTVDAIRHSLDLKEKWIQVTDPFGQKEPLLEFLLLLFAVVLLKIYLPYHLKISKLSFLFWRKVNL